MNLTSKKIFLAKKDKIPTRMEGQGKMKEMNLQMKLSKEALINHLHKLSMKQVELDSRKIILQSKYPISNKMVLIAYKI